MKKILLVATTLALACGLMLGQGSVLAAEGGQQNQIQKEDCRGLFGTVDEIVLNSENVPVTIVLSSVKPVDSTADGSADIALTENTSYHIPITVTTGLTGGAWQKWDQLTEESQDIVLDANRVAILLTDPATDEIAQKVMIVPAKKLYRHRYQHRLGVVVEVEGDTATVAQRNGEQVTVQLGEGADVEVGQLLLAIILAFGSAWAAHTLGLSPALGAFLAGMLLAESPFASQIRSDVGSLRTLFVTLFFTSVGMLADPKWFLANWQEVLVWLGVVFGGKALIIFGIGVAFKMSPAYALAAGITLAQIGEFSFVLATEARSGGLIGEHAFPMAVSLTILSMFLAPYMVTYARPLARRVLGLFASSIIFT